jgi:hypothetical protein
VSTNARLDLGVGDVHQPGAVRAARPAKTNKTMAALDTPERVAQARARLDKSKATLTPEAYAKARADLDRATRALSPDKPRRRKMHLSIKHPVHGRLELHLADTERTVQAPSLLLAAGGGDDGPRWQQIAKVGEFRGHPAGPFALTPVVFSDICRNFTEVDGGQVAFDFEHASELEPTEGSIPAEGAPAQGWIRQLDNRGISGLWALVEWLEPARTYIRQGKYRHVSPAIRFNAKHPETGKPIGARLTSVALTNKPFLRGMVPVMATDTTPAGDGQTVTMSAYSSHEFMPRLRACLKLGELASPAECNDALSRVCDLYEAAGGNPGALVHGVDLGTYTRPMRDLANLPTHHTWEQVFEAMRALIQAAIAEHEVEHHSAEDEDEPPSSRTGAETPAMSDKNHAEENARLLRDNAEQATKLTATETRALKAEADLNAATLTLRARDAEVVTLNEQAAKVQAELDALRAEQATRLAADREAEVAEAIAAHGKAKGIAAGDKDALLALLTASPDAFRKLYPKVDPAKRLLSIEVVPPRAPDAPAAVLGADDPAAVVTDVRGAIRALSEARGISLEAAQNIFFNRKGA